MQVEHPTAAETLKVPLQRLDRLGLCRPDSLTLQRYIEILQTEGLVTRATADAFVALYQEAAFGGGGVDQTSASEVATRLDREVARGSSDSSLVERLALRLHPPPPVDPNPPNGHQEEQSAGDEPSFEDLLEVPRDDVESSPSGPSGRRLGPARRRALLAGVLVLWSLGMVGIGFWKHDSISRSITRFQIRVLRRPWLVPDDIRLRRLRAQAAALPGVTAVWTDYATTAAAGRHYAEALLAYRHLIARDPDNPELLNDLAWMLCTAEDAYARDPVQALGLAERAYALNPTPHITDTLAEAAFQNGDTARAIALEEEALAKLGGNAEFYQRQLAKFRAALEGGE